jgi:hypothetical protein
MVGSAWIQQLHYFAMVADGPSRRVRIRRASLFPDAPYSHWYTQLPLLLLRTAMVVRDDIDRPGPTTSEERATLFAAVLGAAQMNGRGLVLARAIGCRA